MYTRRGDKGQTSLYGPRRVAKDSARVEAYGSVDELNSFLGLALVECEGGDVSVSLRKVQRLLFVAGADLASELTTSKAPRISQSDVAWLEDETDILLTKLPKLTKFVLPGGSRLAANLHVARSVCRRAERRVLAASKSESLNPELLPFFNRLSTYLFDLARYANMLAKVKEEEWSG
jgi:cob(I)alamin adenosyltransferase